MLMELIMELVTASDPKDIERAYRKLEKVGVDRYTARTIAREFYDSEGGDK